MITVNQAEVSTWDFLGTDSSSCVGFMFQSVAPSPSPMQENYVKHDVILGKLLGLLEEKFPQHTLSEMSEVKFLQRLPFDTKVNMEVVVVTDLKSTKRLRVRVTLVHESEEGIFTDIMTFKCKLLWPHRIPYLNG